MLKPTERISETPSILPKTSNVASEASLPIKVEKEYALLSPSRLSLLRTHPLRLELRNRKRSRYSQEYKLADSEDSIPESIDKYSADDRPYRNQYRDCDPSGVSAVDDSRSQGEGIGTSNRGVGDTD
jgi:hypothetical protein